ncbi:MAG: lysophospholipid acyltransferase family protein [Anaerolineae bacterium]
MLRKLLYMGTRGLVKLYSRLMFDLDVLWKEAMPEGAKIVAPNHPTTIDPFLVASLFPGEPRVLIDETLFKVPFGGTLLRLLEQVPVIPGYGRIAYETAKWLLDTGHTVVVFPEGHVSPPEGGLCPLHTGVVRLALETDAPIIPVGIHLDRARVRVLETRVDGEAEVGTWYLRGPYVMTVGEVHRPVGTVDDRPRVRQLTEHLMINLTYLMQESAERAVQKAQRPTFAAGLPKPESGVGKKAALS